MTLAEFEAMVYDIALASSVCRVPALRRLTTTSISLRVDLNLGGFVDVFFNEVTGTTAYAWIVNDRRAFGADNTGGWHIHPLDGPARHDPLPDAMSFADFIAQIELHSGRC